MSDIKYIENENEVAEAIAGGGNVVLLFSAPWCGPCKALKPRIQQVLDTPKHQDVVCLGIDVDEFPDLASKYVIRSVPTIKCFSAGDECGGSKGLMTSGQVDELFTGFKKVHVKEEDACDDECECKEETPSEEAQRTIEEICTVYGLTQMGLLKRLLMADEGNKAEFRECLANELGCASIMPEDPKNDADRVSASSQSPQPLTLIVGDTRIQVSVHGDVACTLKTGDKDAQHFCETSREIFPKFIERVRRDAVVCYLESQLRNMNSSDKEEQTNG